MQINFVRIFLSSLALGLSCFVSEAADVSSDAVSIRFMGIETTRSDLYFKQGDEFVEVKVPLYERSRSYQVEPTGNRVVLYTKTKNPKEDGATEGEPVYEVAAVGKLPLGAQSALCIYFIAPNGQPRLYLYSDDWSDFPKRSYRVINISPVVINSKIDDEIIQVQPFESGIVKASHESDVPTVTVIAVYKDGNDEWQSIHRKRETLLPDWRTTGIAVVTTGKLYEVLDTDYKMDSSNPMKATLSYITLTDDAYSSADRAARRNQAAGQ
jgi:hypothetical protein